ncbi:hypothetical protein B0H14DRAFT_2562434 [Mycena olivaceomarginata]|nr:hypothetical protein B0H14DRAFT_2562434 [Mycena olivaceomarginata]
MGPMWKNIVDLWWALEEAWNFASSTKSLPTTQRPKAVGVWVKNTRKGVSNIGSSGGLGSRILWCQSRGNPAMSLCWNEARCGFALNIGEMEVQWWAWWIGINPSWRVGDGSWDVLKCPGQNRLLNVVITLKWWHGSMETLSESWKCAVGDVEWVLGKMLQRERPNDVPRPCRQRPAQPDARSARRNRALDPPPASIESQPGMPATDAAGPTPGPAPAPAGPDAAQVVNPTSSAAGPSASQPVGIAAAALNAPPSTPPPRPPPPPHHPPGIGAGIGHH